MFDPFGDFKDKGYLRNRFRVSSRDEIKLLEHANFRSNLKAALTYLEQIEGEVAYGDFLGVHRILFEDLYEWAGKDRHQLGVATLVNKGAIQFEASHSIEMAMRHALEHGNDPKKLRASPGYTLGMMAWAHPLLDGNGRTMLLVHGELCRRAGFSIDWSTATMDGYLSALSVELDMPGSGSLDRYMLQRKHAPICMDEWQLAPREKRLRSSTES